MYKLLGKVFLPALLAVLLCAVPLFAQAETSGTCGENLTWVLDDEGTLTISGTGSMTNYDSGNHAPWGTDVHTAVITPGATSVGNFAFEHCSLTSIKIPDTVTSIGSAAFQGCSNLAEANIPAGVTAIGNHAFFSCSSLTGITIPDGVSRIESSTFQGCSSLTEISIPASVTSIVSYAFSGCTNLATIRLPDSMTGIGGYAFENCSSLTSIDLPAGIPGIEMFTFESCSNLASVTIPDGVTKIGSYAFRHCSSLTSVTLPDSVTSIETCAFAACSNMTSINIPNGVTSIQNYVFEDCSSLKHIVLPDHVTSIGYAAFLNCSSLTSINIPDGMTKIDGFAFNCCSSLTSLTLPDSVSSIGGYAFAGCENLSRINIPENVTKILDFTFSACKSLTSIQIPANVTSIGEYAFYYCSGLKSIRIPDGVTSISNSTFRFCSNLANVTLPSSVTSIGIFAFDECKALQTIYFPDSLVSIDNRAFESQKYDVTVYCNEYSYAETWAQQTKHNYVLLDAGQVKINMTSELTVPVGAVRPADCAILCGDPVVNAVWTSSAPAVASVDENGIISALRSGTAVITVRVNNTSASCTLTVVEPAASLSLPETIWIVAKTAQPAPLSLTPADAVTQLTYKTDDPAYLQLSQDGIMTAGAVGTTTLSVQDSISGLMATATVRITYPVSAVVFQPDSVTLTSGQTVQLNARVTMRTDSCTNQLVTFNSSKPSVAAVDQNGVVTAVRPGTAIVTATADSGISASCTITVHGDGSTLPGDANLDGMIDMYDALVLLQCIADGSAEGDDTLDVDGNGTVDLMDALMILQQEAGW